MKSDPADVPSANLFVYPHVGRAIADGVTDGYVCLSVGIELIDDILADLDQALAVA